MSLFQVLHGFLCNSIVALFDVTNLVYTSNHARDSHLFIRQYFNLDFEIIIKCISFPIKIIFSREIDTTMLCTLCCKVLVF